MISLTPDIHQVQVKSPVDEEDLGGYENSTQQLETLLAHYNKKYLQLKEILQRAVELLADSREPKTENGRHEFLTDLDKEDLEVLSETDKLAVSLTRQLLIDVEAAYDARAFYKMWDILFDFCRTDFQFYIEHLYKNPLDKEALEGSSKPSTPLVLSSILIVILQRLSPFHPFLTEEIYAEVVPNSRSIFQNKTLHLPTLSEQCDVKPQWESMKADVLHTVSLR